jgi:hypothetical protein
VQTEAFFPLGGYFIVKITAFSLISALKVLRLNFVIKNLLVFICPQNGPGLKLTIKFLIKRSSV